MNNFLELENVFMVNYFVTKLPKLITINELLDFYPLISKRSIFRYIKDKKFKCYHFHKVVYVETKSFAEFLFEI